MEKKRIKKEGSGYEKNLNQEPKKDIYIYNGMERIGQSNCNPYKTKCKKVYILYRRVIKEATEG